VALKRLRFLPAICLLLATMIAQPVAFARAETLPMVEASVPSLQDFASQVMNGQADELRGIYAPGLFADRVVEQPPGQLGYISTGTDVVTRFSGATRLGSTGLLAHNYLAGAQFERIQAAQVMYLIFGDGRTVSYSVTDIQQYQALQPNSAYSGFVDLHTGSRLGASALFSKIYDRKGALILQTCIGVDGVSTWGRLFVIATPAPDQGSRWPSCHGCQ
jgi:hypothetical protein